MHVRTFRSALMLSLSLAGGCAASGGSREKASSLAGRGGDESAPQSPTAEDLRTDDVWKRCREQLQQANATAQAALTTDPETAGGAAEKRTSDSTLSKEMIRAAIQDHLDEVRVCYEQFLLNDSAEGRVEMRFVITADGSVSESEMVGGEPRLKQTGDCIASRMRSWNFPKPGSADIVIVTYPFNLLAGDATRDFEPWITQVMEAGRPDVRRCYERALAQEPNAAGKVEISLVIGPKGNVVRAEATHNETAISELGCCIATMVRGWTFPKHDTDAGTVVTYPFFLQPERAASQPMRVGAYE